MEGISHEACSLAGTLEARQADRASTTTTASRSTARSHGWFTDDTPKRFEAYGWHVDRRRRRPRRRCGRRRDRGGARAKPTRPTLICCKTIIGKGAPNKQGTADGARRGARRRTRSPPTRKALGWQLRAVRDSGRDLRRAGTRATRGAKLRSRLGRRVRRATRDAHPGAGRRVRAAHARRAAGRTGPRIAGARSRQRQRARPRPSPRARRRRSALEAFAPALPELHRRLGRPDRLEPHDLVKGVDARSRRTTPAGNYIHYGVREFGMTAIMNGIALHGGFIPYGGTFLTFSDYARNARAHGGADDGARRSIVLHARLDRPRRGRPDAPADRASARACALIPHMDVWRPCDTVETAVAWARGHRAHDGPDRAGAHAPEPAARSRARRSRSRTSRAAATCWSTASGAPEAHRSSRPAPRCGLALRRPNALADERHRACASSRCRAPRCSTRQDEAYRASVLPARRRAPRGRGRRDRRLVAVRRRRRRRHRHRHFGESAPARPCSSTSASRSTRVAAARPPSAVNSATCDGASLRVARIALEIDESKERS